MNEKQEYQVECMNVQEKAKGNKFRRVKKTFATVLCAAIAGGVAGASFYSVNTYLASASMQQGSENSANVSYVSADLSKDLDVSDIASIGLSSVVSVTNVSVQEVQNYFGKFGGGQRQLQETTSCGSGVIIYEDSSYVYIVSNYHVVEGADTLSVTFVDEETYEAQLCGYDESMDIALLKVAVGNLSSATAEALSVITVGDSDELNVGEQVVAIGNALGYGQSVTTGIISALDRTVSTDTSTVSYIQTDAAINPGNSGGALLDMDGNLIGINTAKVSSTDVEGIGYAIPISDVMDLITSFIG